MAYLTGGEKKILLGLSRRGKLGLWLGERAQSTQEGGDRHSGDLNLDGDVVRSERSGKNLSRPGSDALPYSPRWLLLPPPPIWLWLSFRPFA